MPQPTPDLPHDPAASAVWRVADLLVSRALADHAGEIDIIAYYGSYAQGVARPGSDLDIFYIPAEGQDPPVGHTVLVEGLLYDFWGLRWETVEGFATGRMRGWAFAPALVHHARVLHARSDEQAARFAALQQSVLDLQKPEARSQMIHRAVDAFKNVLAHLGNLRLAAAAARPGRRALCRLEAGPRRLRMPCPGEPDLFPAAVGGISWRISPSCATGPTIWRPPSSPSAASGRRAGHRRRRRSASPWARAGCCATCRQRCIAQREPREVFESAYPELKDGLGKVLRACERQQPVAASAAAWSAQSELSPCSMIWPTTPTRSDSNLYSEFASPYRQLGFPDLLGRQLYRFGRPGRRRPALDDRLRRWLGEQGVSLNEFDTLEEFERSLC